MAQRFLVENLVTDPTATLLASSEDAAHPLSWLRDQAPGKPWRSRVGWTFVADFNVSGSFERAGFTRSFVIDAGYHATPDSAAAAILAALNAGDPGPTWGVTYSPVTNKFTISCSQAFAPNCADDGLAGCWLDIGFAITANRAAATTQESSVTSYMSRQYIGVYYPAGLPGFLRDAYIMAWAHGHGTGGAFYAGTGVSLIGALQNATSNPAVTTGGASHRIAVTTAAGHTYLVMYISNGSNTQGYCEVANFFVGSYKQPTYSWTFTGYQREPQDLSGVEHAVSGAHVRSSRSVRNVWSVDWDALSEADMDVLRDIKAACPRGRNLWIIPNPSDLSEVNYVTMESGPTERLAAATLYGPAATFAEVLP